MHIVLPGKSNSSVQLERFAAQVSKCFAYIGTCSGDGFVSVDSVVGLGHCCIARGCPERFEGNGEIGQTMFDGLEAGNTSTKLHAIFEILNGHVKEMFRSTHTFRCL